MTFDEADMMILHLLLSDRESLGLGSITPSVSAISRRRLCSMARAMTSVVQQRQGRSTRDTVSNYSDASRSDRIRKNIERLDKSLSYAHMLRRLLVKCVILAA